MELEVANDAIALILIPVSKLATVRLPQLAVTTARLPEQLRWISAQLSLGRAHEKLAASLLECRLRKSCVSIGTCRLS